MWWACVWWACARSRWACADAHGEMRYFWANRQGDSRSRIGVTRRSISYMSHSLSPSLTIALALTWLMWLWRVMIPLEDWSDVTLVFEDTDDDCCWRLPCLAEAALRHWGELNNLWICHYQACPVNQFKFSWDFGLSTACNRCYLAFGLDTRQPQCIIYKSIWWEDLWERHQNPYMHICTANCALWK